jgi:hypothetical protein
MAKSRKEIEAMPVLEPMKELEPLDQMPVLEPIVKRRRYGQYTAQFKLEVIHYMEEMKKSIKETADHFGLNESTVRHFIKKKEDLEALRENPARKRLRGGGRKTPYARLESALFKWLEDHRVRNVPLSTIAIQHKAMTLRTMADRDFRASTGWLNNFMKRYNMLPASQPKPTCQKPPQPSTAAVEETATTSNVVSGVNVNRRDTQNATSDGLLASVRAIVENALALPEPTTELHSANNDVRLGTFDEFDETSNM